MPVLYMGYLAHYTLLLRKHKGLYSSLYISHQYTEGPRNPVVFAGLFEGTVLIPSCQLIIGLRWIQFSNYKAYCLFQYHFWQFMYGQSRKLLLPASFSLHFQRVRKRMRPCSVSPPAQYFSFFVTKSTFVA